jgi:hypothetical protein
MIVLARRGAEPSSDRDARTLEMRPESATFRGFHVILTGDMSESGVLERYLFTLHDPRVAALDLGTAPPVAVQRMAAIVVLATSTRRRFWKSGQMSVDSVDSFRDVFVPTEIVRSPGMLAFEPAFEALVPEEPNAALACTDLRPVAQESAYRGAMRQQSPDFMGHDFADTIELAIAGLRGFFSWRGKELGRTIRAFAWPFLWLRFAPESERPSLAIVPDEDGGLHVVAADPAP